MANFNAFWQTLKRWAKVAGDFQARLILSVLYALLVLPTGLIVKLGGDLLHSRYPDQTNSFWRPRSADSGALRPARRQG